jgi:hypothetical protein
VDGHLACVADLGSVDGPDGFAGILGAWLFEGYVATTDPDVMTLTVREAGHFQSDGYEVPIDVRRDGPSLAPFVALVLPTAGRCVSRWAPAPPTSSSTPASCPDCGVQVDGHTVTTKSGTDETSHQWIRHWATVSGDVHLAAAPETAQSAARVQVQDIIHGGLIGTEYVERYRITLD